VTPTASSAKPLRNPSQLRAHETRRALLEAAEREFSERGYAGTTAKTIAERAETATGSFYQYFANKDDVLRAIATQRQEQVVSLALEHLEALPRGKATLADARSRMRSVVELVIAYHANDKGLHAVLTERRHADPELDRLTSEGEARIVARIADLLERWKHTGDREATAFVLFGMLEGAVHAHVLGRPIVDDVRFKETLVESLLRIALPTRKPDK
jgi:AcrR family transcriptional regulator